MSLIYQHSKGCWLHMSMHSNYTFKQGENYLIFSEYFLHFAEILLLSCNVCTMPVFGANHQSFYLC